MAEHVDTAGRFGCFFMALISLAWPRPLAAQAPTYVNERRELMSTLYQITVLTHEEAKARAAIHRAFDEVARLESLLSEWRMDSEVSQINEAAGRQPVRVGADTLANVRMALQVAAWTGGAFDITWAALRPFYLFRAEDKTPPDLIQVRANLHRVNWRDLVVDPKASTVFLRHAGMAIGLGGIAKGWAVDRAAEILQSAGLRNFMIFAGGQVLVRGRKNERAWRVGIQHPRRDDYIGFVEASDVSIATSGDYEHAFVAGDGRRWHHIIDLKTGLPSTASLSVTLVARTGLLADGLDTGCFVMGPKACLAMLKTLPEPVDAVIIGPDFRLHTTPGLRGRLVMRMPLDKQGRIPK